MRRGFTLSELLISLLILSVLSVVMVGVIPATVMGIRTASQRATAANLARDAIERMRAQGFSLLQNEPPSVIQVNNTDFTLEVVTGPATGSTGAPLDQDTVREVFVTVRWMSRQGPKAYSTRTFITRPQ